MIIETYDSNDYNLVIFFYFLESKILIFNSNIEIKRLSKFKLEFLKAICVENRMYGL